MCILLDWLHAIVLQTFLGRASFEHMYKNKMHEQDVQTFHGRHYRNYDEFLLRTIFMDASL